MARKDKLAEMRDRLKEYKSFAAEVDFIAYSVRICVLATDYADALAKLEAHYPGLTCTIAHQQTTVII